MADLESYVSDVAAKVADLVPDDFVSNGQILSLDAGILIKLNLGDLAERLAQILGPKDVQEFYRDYERKSVEGTFHLTMPLARLIPACCRISDNRRITVDERQLLDRLARFADCVKNGTVNYTINLRLANIDIESEFKLAEGIQFRKLSPEMVARKYPIERQFTPVLPMQEKHWLNHCVEVVISRRGKMSDFQEWNRVEQSEALVNSILHTFLIADIPERTSPAVTHFLLDSPVESICHHRGLDAFSFQPPLLSSEDVVTLQHTHSVLQNADKDRVLRTAIDRFILGKKRGEHHPNRINEPN